MDLTDLRIIDCHVHCGTQNVSWLWEEVKPLLKAAGIREVGLIPPVEDIYDRYDPGFTDDARWQKCRRQAHRYLLELQDPDIAIHRYFFVWNDFAWEELRPEYVAIKWHRHGNEPEYHYQDPRCREFLEVVKARGLPILLEETFNNTLFFLEKLLPAGVPLIIPHLGGLNGGYQALSRAGVWGHPQVYADSALAGFGEIEDYLGRFGPMRLLFGSDYPFSYPYQELAKLLHLNLRAEEAQAILGGNFLRLCGLSTPEG